MTSQKIVFFSLVLLSALIAGSCGTRERTYAYRAYMEYLADPENGLCKEKSIAGLKYKVKYLPGQYLAYNTLKNTVWDEKQRDSLIKIYSNSLCFLINIGPAEGESFDITRLGVSDYETFAERIEKMAFDAPEWIGLRVNQKIFAPSIVRLENINALERSRNFVVVFANKDGSIGELLNNDLCLSYTDELFHTGINNFLFEAKHFRQLPELKFN